MTEFETEMDFKTEKLQDMSIKFKHTNHFQKLVKNDELNQLSSICHYTKGVL